MLRVIAGRHRGRRLIAPEGQGTRPTAERVRQALFDMLWHAPWAGRDAVRVETARAYLLAIARNLCRDRGRQAKQWPTAPMPERVVPPDAETRLELDRVLAAIDTLPIEYREPLVLAASGVAYDEIARMLGIAAGTVKIRVHRARLKLAAATEGAPVETT